MVRGNYAIGIPHSEGFTYFYNEYLYRYEQGWERWVTLKKYINSKEDNACDFPSIYWEDENYVYLMLCYETEQNNNSVKMIITIYKINTKEKDITLTKRLSCINALSPNSFRGEAYELYEYKNYYIIIYPIWLAYGGDINSQLSLIAIDKKLNRDITCCIITDNFDGEVDASNIDISKGLLYIEWHNSSNEYFDKTIDLNYLLESNSCSNQ
jgi:hypothetical protein